MLVDYRPYKRYDNTTKPPIAPPRNTPTPTTDGEGRMGAKPSNSAVPIVTEKMNSKAPVWYSSIKVTALFSVISIFIEGYQIIVVVRKLALSKYDLERIELVSLLVPEIVEVDLCNCYHNSCSTETVLLFSPTGP